MEFFYNNKRKRLDIGVLMEGLLNIDAKTSRWFVDVPENKDALHLARYFGGDLLKATANGLSIQDVINSLDISEEHFYSFLSEKVCIDIGFAKKLELVKGTRFNFWLRIQKKLDHSNKVQGVK